MTRNVMRFGGRKPCSLIKKIKGLWKPKEIVDILRTPQRARPFLHLLAHYYLMPSNHEYINPFLILLD